MTADNNQKVSKKFNIMKLQTQSQHSQTPRFSNTAPPAVQKIA